MNNSYRMFDELSWVQKTLKLKTNLFKIGKNMDTEFNACAENVCVNKPNA